MAQDVVDNLKWLQPNTMIDGLGLAETTPGPLILVTEFVGFITAFKFGGLIYGFAGALMALWATFIPCFLWIFLGAPYIEWMTHQPRLQGGLSSIMAAVVGVIANLFLWFVINIIFTSVTSKNFGPINLLIPDFKTVNLSIVLIASICGAISFWREIGLLTILLFSATLGLLLGLIIN